MEVGDLGEEGQVAGGVWGQSANPHYVALVPGHPNENQRLSGLTGVEGWVGLGLEEVGGWNWGAEKERGLWLRGIIFKSASEYANNKQTHLESAGGCIVSLVRSAPCSADVAQVTLL